MATEKQDELAQEPRGQAETSHQAKAAEPQESDSRRKQRLGEWQGAKESAAPAQPQEKKLWGTPLKLKQAEERIVELEVEVARFKAQPVTSVPSGEPIVIGRPSREIALIPVGIDRGTGNPERWIGFEHDSEKWEYREVLPFQNDSGYAGSIIPDRILALARNAIAKPYEKFGPQRFTEKGQPTGESTMEYLPAFDRTNVLEVIVRVRRV